MKTKLKQITPDSHGSHFCQALNRPNICSSSKVNLVSDGIQIARLLVIAAIAIFMLPACNTKPAEISFNNPLALQRADPWVYKAEDGTYYFIATAPEFDRIEIRKSSTINGIADAEPVIVWSKNDSGPMSHHIWAPELHRIDGKWYIYVAAGRAEDVWRIRMWVLSNTSDDPTTGEWVKEGQIYTTRDGFALDATTFVHRGQRYMVWAERTSDTVHSTGLIISRMKDPLTLEGPQVVISEPEHDWEIQRYRVNEGAAFIARNNKVFIAYSASATDQNYAVGLLWAHDDADLLDPTSWTKLPEPVFYTNPEFSRYGPGHNSFTVAEDGKTDIFVYHTRDYRDLQVHPLRDPNRHTRARVLNWTEDGFPDFGQNIND